ncbi:G-type lectin S-receptor-like serine/threonine-protein kinase SD2-5 [Bidens hawaiensis]|uniref:G-type lectin S-receptor-like serine/threonine-protein kinase SD2-5 n=1 Tax=Bidens hawaiensis TaxID=980011 RepID=UPI0040493C3A
MYSSTPNLSTTWDSTDLVVYDDEEIQIRPILLRGTPGSTGFACGFFCNGNCTSYLFVVYIVETDDASDIMSYDLLEFAQVIWSANRDYPVRFGAKLNFTATGNLVLQDVDGSIVWTTNTTGKAVGMNLTDAGNLVLFDVNSSVVWQSFDYPTDCLVMGQRLYQGQQLIPSVSSTNWAAQEGLFSLQVTDQALIASVGSNQNQFIYYYGMNFGNETNKERKYITFLNGSLSFDEPGGPDSYIRIPEASSAQYIKFMPDGHLKVFKWQAVVADLLTNAVYGECTYPLVCGRNAICSSYQQCSCPVSSSPRIDYFRAVNDRQPNLGCSAITPLACNATQDQVFISLQHVTIPGYLPQDMYGVSMETCKQACANNCSCKAAVFDPEYGICFLLYEISALVSINRDTSTFIKAQNVKSTPQIPKKKSRPAVAVITSIIGSFLVVGIFIASIIRKLRPGTQVEEEYIDVVPGLPTRFTHEELKTATDNFSKKIGQGGFGLVFEGTLEDDSKIAVKRLDGLGHVNKSFLAEVESIGSIHHVNLVRLRGFGAWKAQRFLVYDFMSNGSLDKWIYHGVREQILKWECRRKIILDIAKGLEYLHEDCMQKIIHLDIKPQNILLDTDFNAKVSDFGLSKLIDRDERQVMTRMRGTPGYMAPEWLSSVITEKVDVYSFGVVLLEILCGRKNFDRSQPEESCHLLSVFQKCWEQGALLDIVDKYSEDMQTRGQEVVEMMKVASWCLQTNFTRRPSMSVVVKVLEGVMNVESNLDFNFTDPRLQNKAVEHERDLTPVLASALSGPR